MTDHISDEQLGGMVRWAGNRGAQVVLRGEIGFGRPCVGITFEGGYLDFAWTWSEHTESVVAFEEAMPEDAYHKHPCLAVLVHNEDYDEALAQLYKWYEFLVDNNWRIVTADMPSGTLAGLLGETKMGELRPPKESA